MGACKRVQTGFECVVELRVWTERGRAGPGGGSGLRGRARAAHGSQEARIERQCKILGISNSLARTRSFEWSIPTRTRRGLLRAKFGQLLLDRRNRRSGNLAHGKWINAEAGCQMQREREAEPAKRVANAWGQMRI